VANHVASLFPHIVIAMAAVAEKFILYTQPG
jgi:hypothetical protein